MVEMTIGMLKAQFQYLRNLRVTPERPCDISVILHNIATIREQCPIQPVNDPDNEPDHPAEAPDGRDNMLPSFLTDQSPPQCQTKTMPSFL
jgi:hypothetical protein